ncbi:mechanosensitive ion channel family protein [Candidatus Woesearchaeota archaeon]|nr:mechanosensitive ion channel family protein [Candidatus Woesearchaeota archaeon]
MNFDLGEILSLNWWNNTVQDYVVATAIFIIVFALFKLFNYYLLNKLEKLAKKTKTEWDDLVIDFIKEIKWFFYFLLSVYIASQYLTVLPLISKIIYHATIVFAGFYVAKGISKAINHFIEIKIAENKDKKSKSSASLMNLLGLLAKIAIWTIALLMILSNAGIEITPLIASLGIGGIAIALALQSVLADLFGAFIIYFDKPFKEGDFIIVGSDMGVVKHIGIKSTRIQALQGQELVMSNTELVNSRVNNYKQMEKRRIVFGFGVKYDTGKVKLAKIKGIVNKIFEKIEGADLDRVHFKEFGDFSLNYEVVYYVKSSDYNQYMDIQESVNMNLYEEFEKAKIGFAFPTQTIELENYKK